LHKDPLKDPLLSGQSGRARRDMPRNCGNWRLPARRRRSLARNLDEDCGLSVPGWRWSDRRVGHGPRLTAAVAPVAGHSQVAEACGYCNRPVLPAMYTPQAQGVRARPRRKTGTRHQGRRTRAGLRDRSDPPGTVAQRSGSADGPRTGNLLTAAQKWGEAGAHARYSVAVRTKSVGPDPWGQASAGRDRSRSCRMLKAQRRRRQ
jgi:hypothetical protein